MSEYGECLTRRYLRNIEIVYSITVTIRRESFHGFTKS